MTIRRLSITFVFAVFLVASVLIQASPPKGVVHVALYAGAGTSGKGPKLLEETLHADGLFAVTPITPEEIRAGRLKDFKVLIVPGGLSQTQGIALGEDGREMVRQFVSGGGTYVGICAGCYLASCHYKWSLNILPVKVVDSANWERGVTPLLLGLTAEGKDWLSRKEGEVKLIYHNGPVLAPLEEPKEKLVVLATYREEVTRKGAKEGLMVNTPALVAARYGKGWAIGISPHPEMTEGYREMVPAAIRWTLKHCAQE